QSARSRWAASWCPWPAERPGTPAGHRGRARDASRHKAACASTPRNRRAGSGAGAIAGEDRLGEVGKAGGTKMPMVVPVFQLSWSKGGEVSSKRYGPTAKG